MDLRKYAQFALKAQSRQKQRPKFQNRNLPFLSISDHFSKFPAIKPKKKEVLAPVDYVSSLNRQQGDLVRVLYGKDAGREGIIKRIFKDNLVSVSGTSLLPNKQETLIHILNVVPLDPVLRRPTRIKTRISMSGQKVRISKLSRCAMPRPVRYLRKATKRSSGRNFRSSSKPNLPTRPSVRPKVPETRSQALSLIKHRLASAQ